jgi:hypothetical protein
MLAKQCYSFFRLLCWTNNVIIYLNLYVGCHYKILHFISNCLLRMKIGNYSIFHEYIYIYIRSGS